MGGLSRNITPWENREVDLSNRVVGTHRTFSKDGTEVGGHRTFSKDGTELGGHRTFSKEGKQRGHRTLTKDGNVNTGGTRRAEIQRIQRGVDDKGGNRDRSRIRRQYRASHVKEIHANDDVTVGTVNMQGANWSRTEERHIAKFNCLMDIMREKKVDVMCVTDLHGAVDERAGLDTRYATCMVEEFLLVSCGKVGFMVTPAIYKLWGGEALVWDRDGRVATTDIEIDGCKLRFGSAYMPPRGGDRQNVIDTVKKIYEETDKDKPVVIGGDWNSHIGREEAVNRQAILGESSAGGREMLNWLDTLLKDKMVVADHRIPLRRRGTWCSTGGKWYEIDYFLASEKYVGRCGKLQAVAVGESDHMAKIMNVRLAAGQSSAEKRRWRQHAHTERTNFDTSRLHDDEVRKEYEDALDKEIDEGMTWTEAGTKLREVAAEVLGPRPSSGVPKIAPSREQEIKKVRDEGRALFEQARECGDEETARNLLKESRKKWKEHRALTRKAESDKWRAFSRRWKSQIRKKTGGLSGQICGS